MILLDTLRSALITFICQFSLFTSRMMPELQLDTLRSNWTLQGRFLRCILLVLFKKFHRSINKRATSRAMGPTYISDVFRQETTLANTDGHIVCAVTIQKILHARTGVVLAWKSLVLRSLVQIIGKLVGMCIVTTIMDPM